MARKRGAGYRPPAGKGRAPDRVSPVPTTVVSIDMTAIKGRAGVVVGSRVR